MSGGGRDIFSVRSVFPLDGSLLVTAPSAIWTYNPAGGRWDTLHTDRSFVSAGAGGDFASFGAAFAIKDNDASTLYSFITTKRGDADSSALYRFDEGSERWAKAVGRADFSVFPAAGGFYALFANNDISFYRTVYGADREDSLVAAPEKFREKFAQAGDAVNPKVNDILFLPRGGNSGTLAVAATTGLYVCESAEPLSGGVCDAFTLVSEVRAVKQGEAYALPGIMRNSSDGRYDKCVFVYRLKKDGNVTIKVYDYRMSLVKTVIKGEDRRAYADGTRSTIPSRDAWDGTNEAGKRAWPGVYYFKITSSGGDRLFGKVILAK
jgi:hypothetical protein